MSLRTLWVQKGAPSSDPQATERPGQGLILHLLSISCMKSWERADQLSQSTCAILGPRRLSLCLVHHGDPCQTAEDQMKRNFGHQPNSWEGDLVVTG